MLIHKNVPPYINIVPPPFGMSGKTNFATPPIFITHQTHVKNVFWPLWASPDVPGSQTNTFLALKNTPGTATLTLHCKES